MQSSLHAATRQLKIWITVSLLFTSFTFYGQPILQRIERAKPEERVRLVLNYFDTCRVIIQKRTSAFRLLDQLTALAQQQQDRQFERYCQFVGNTYAKHDPKLTNRQKAALFLAVAQKAEADNDAEIAHVSEHFAGMYYFLADDYAPAFQYLLSAYAGFQKAGYANVPCIHRYLYDLAYAYFNLRDERKAIELLTEARQYEPFNQNLHLQTYNTLGLAYTRLDSSAANQRLAEQHLLRTRQLALTYGDSAWVGIASGNLGQLYARQRRWQAALQAYRIEYRLNKLTKDKTRYPTFAACRLADVFGELGQLDSCRYYLNSRANPLLRDSIDVTWKLQDDAWLYLYYSVVRRYYGRVGNLALANRYADSVLHYQTILDRRSRSRVVTLAEQRLLVQQHQAEVDRLEQRAQTQRLLLGIGVGVAALVALLLGLLYRATHRQRQQEALAHAEREKRLELERNQAQTDRDRVNAELAQFLENLQTAEAKTDLAEARLITPTDWDEFRRRFERVHPFFFEQLRTQFPDLTPAEERLLVLSKLDFDSHRISLILGISMESIRKTRYRLRKRIGLAGNAPLTDWLDELTRT